MGNPVSCATRRFPGKKLFLNMKGIAMIAWDAISRKCPRGILPGNAHFVTQLRAGCRSISSTLPKIQQIARAVIQDQQGIHQGSVLPVIVSLAGCQRVLTIPPALQWIARPAILGLQGITPGSALFATALPAGCLPVSIIRRLVRLTAAAVIVGMRHPITSICSVLLAIRLRGGYRQPSAMIQSGRQTASPVTRLQGDIIQLSVLPAIR